MTWVMDLNRFSAALADRLAAIVPGGFHVAAADGMLWYSAEAGGIGRAGTYVRDNFGVYGPSDEDNIVGVAVQALGELQDYISEATGTPWPGSTSQPSPHGQIRDSYLHLWYGANDAIILACEPIQVIDVD